MLRVVCVIFSLYIVVPIEVWSTNCPDGQQCAESHECCPGGCCLPRPPHHRPPHHPEFFNFSTPMKYYLWLLLSIAAFVLTLAWCCRLRQQAAHWRCGWRPWPCRTSQQRSPDTDSAGSCYYPPQYSRCGSLCRATVQPAPPPYSEVTSKPDLYPMVIYLGADKGDGDFMVQYFKNYIVRPLGSISATSTADSLSSGYLCNTANEANSIIPPPYSCAGSVDWSGSPVASPAQRQALLRSVSAVTCHVSTPSHNHMLHASNSGRSHSSNQATYQNNPEHSAQITVTHHQVSGSQISGKNKFIAHSKSVPNSRLFQDDLNMRIYSQESNSDMSSPEYQISYLNEGCSGTHKGATNSNNSKNFLGSKSPRVQINKHQNENYCEPNDNNHSTSAYGNNSFALERHSNINNINIRKIRNDESVESYVQSEVTDEEPNRHYNIQQTNRENSFPEGSSGRNTSIFNLNSLEENNLCSFYSQSNAEGCTIDNVSSDYSNFVKNLNNFGSKEDFNIVYSVGGSMTGSSISSLANLGTPDSPPRATSPTSELKQILDKIQSLPGDDDMSQSYEDDHHDSNFVNEVKEIKNFFSKSRKNNLYMPLNVNNQKSTHAGKVSPSSNMCFKRQFARRSWLSRSAPSTPCGSGFVPNILTVTQRSGMTPTGRSSRQSKSEQEDGSPLLTERVNSEDEGEQP